MGDRLQAGKPSRYVTSHPGQLSLAIPPWVGAVSTSESWDVNRHTARCTSPVSVVWQCKLVSDWGLRKLRSAPALCALWLGKDFTFLYVISLTLTKTKVSEWVSRLNVALDTLHVHLWWWRRSAQPQCNARRSSAWDIGLADHRPSRARWVRGWGEGVEEGFQ